MHRPGYTSFVRRALAGGLLVVAPTACSSSTEAPEQILTFEVAATLAPCVAVGPTTCLQVREPGDSAWQLFYNPIEGFTHQAGYQYTLRVARRTVANPPADGSSAAYRLVEEVGKVAVP